MDSPKIKDGECRLCHRDTRLTFHHLIPRKVHRRTYFKKHYSREELGRGINICRLCHKALHILFDEMTLAKKLNTLEAIGRDEAVIKHCAWVSRQK